MVRVLDFFYDLCVDEDEESRKNTQIWGGNKRDTDEHRSKLKCRITDSGQKFCIIKISRI